VTSTVAPILISFTVFVVVIVMVVALMVRQARRTFPKSIVSRLRETGDPVILTISRSETTWNPAQKGAASRLRVKGTATYTLDEAGVVHLTFEPKRGKAQHFSGPAPKLVEPNSPLARKLRRLQRGMLFGYVLLVLVGFYVGVLLAGGTALAHLLWGLFGMLMAMMFAWFLMLVFRVGLSIRQVKRDGL